MDTIKYELSHHLNVQAHWTGSYINITEPYIDITVAPLLKDYTDQFKPLFIGLLPNSKSVKRKYATKIMAIGNTTRLWLFDHSRVIKNKGRW